MVRTSKLFILIFLSFSVGFEILHAGQIPVIPLPAVVQPGVGSFPVSGRTVISAPGNSAIRMYLREAVRQKTGLELQIDSTFVPSEPAAGTIILKMFSGSADLGREGYALLVSSDRVLATASAPAGLFYACQTILQLLSKDVESGGTAASEVWSLPGLKIEDFPRFGWRGLMVDCSRTFQSLSYLRRNIDRLARYKLNVLHLHLTDDQGWRLEIKKYPKLTSTGAKFAPQYKKEGGFYTQQQMKELIRYATQRQVKIVPEIEMPGHCLAALASYPQLSCSGKQFEIYPFFEGPNIQDNVFCAGNEEVFDFLEGVLDEVAGLFPCEFLHIGGDEVPNASWKACPKCRQRIREEGLADENELQSWFVRRIEKILNQRGKRLIGWDEILEGGLAPNAAVMSWRGMEGGIEAAGQGHEVVMSPTSHCYLDYTHEAISVEKAYSFEPLPGQLNQLQRKHILGLQGNIWTHIATNEADTDRQVYPRLIALAEVGWSPAALRDWQSFSGRLQEQLEELSRLGVQYYENWR